MNVWNGLLSLSHDLILNCNPLKEERYRTVQECRDFFALWKGQVRVDSGAFHWSERKTSASERVETEAFLDVKSPALHHGPKISDGELLIPQKKHKCFGHSRERPVQRRKFCSLGNNFVLFAKEAFLNVRRKKAFKGFENSIQSWNVLASFEAERNSATMLLETQMSSQKEPRPLLILCSQFPLHDFVIVQLCRCNCFHFCDNFVYCSWRMHLTCCSKINLFSFRRRCGKVRA